MPSGRPPASTRPTSRGSRPRLQTAGRRCVRERTARAEHPSARANPALTRAPPLDLAPHPAHQDPADRPSMSAALAELGDIRWPPTPGTPPVPRLVRASRVSHDGRVSPPVLVGSARHQRRAAACYHRAVPLHLERRRLDTNAAHTAVAVHHGAALAGEVGRRARRAGEGPIARLRHAHQRPAAGDEQKRAAHAPGARRQRTACCCQPSSESCNSRAAELRKVVQGPVQLQQLYVCG